MPSSIRTIDATAQRYGPIESLETSAFGSPPRISTSKMLSRQKSEISQAPMVHAQMQLPPSPAESDIPLRHGTESPAPSIGKDGLACRYTNNIDRGAPGDAAIFSKLKTPEQKELARRKSQYYGEAFAYREANGSARERVSKNSIILADVRTNVIIQDEYQFITDLSYQLSTRYQRSENSIVVTVSHSTCLLFAGNFDPAYILTITALPTQLQPVTNKRNSTLLSKAMEDVLGVSPDRGLIKFLPIAEENLATNGKTVAGEIEDAEKEAAGENGLTASLSRGKSTKGSRRHSIKSLRGRATSTLPTHNEGMTPVDSLNGWESPSLPAVPTEKTSLDRKADKAPKMGRRKSFMQSLFGKS